MYYYQNYIINIVHTMHALYTKSSDAKNSFKEHFKEQIYWINDQISPNCICEPFRLVLWVNFIQNSQTKRTDLIPLYTNLR